MSEPVAVQVRVTRIGQSQRWQCVFSRGDELLFDDAVRLLDRKQRGEFIAAAIKSHPGLFAHRAELAAALDADAMRAMEQSEQPAAGPALQGTALTFADPEPWPEPVDAAALLAAMRHELGRYIILPDHADVAVALWCLHSFAVECSDYTPRLLVSSPEKRCGKSRTMRVIGAMVRRPLAVENLSAATLFRVVEAHQPTILADEADAWLVGQNADDSLRGILNAGVEPGGTVLRCAGDDAEVRAFKVFAPVALAMIGSPPSTILDRSVVVRLRRAMPGEVRERLRLRDVRADVEPLRRQAVRWVADTATRLRAADPDTPASLDDRATDLWRPLLAIADLAGGEWPALARTSAEALTGGRDAEDPASRGVELLRDIRAAFAARDVARIGSQALASALAAVELSPWSEWGRLRRPISAVQVARLLGPFGVRPTTMRLPDGSRTKGYERSDFVDAWDRYCGSTPPSDPCSRDNPETARVSGRNASVTPAAVSRFAKDREARNGAGCHGVTDQKGVAAEKNDSRAWEATL